MGFKIGHLSDAHLGYKSTRRLNKQGINLREADGYIVFSKIIDEMIQESVDAVIVAGDTFHIPTPDIRTIIFAQNQLRRLSSAGIPVYILAGNHDTNDVKADIAASRILHDPARKIYSHVEPYIHYEISPGIHIHLVSHHMYNEQDTTMNQVKIIPEEINIFSTHGSVIDPLLQEKLHTAQSPREIVIPDALLNDNNWDYIMLGHIHERGWVGSKDHKTDTLEKKIYYNGSTIRRGFSDKETPLGRGWTLWEIDESTGVFTATPKTITQRPQYDFDIIDANDKTAQEVSDLIISNLLDTQINQNNFDSNTAPIIRQRVVNLEHAKQSALDWAQINAQSEHALAWTLKPLIKDIDQDEDVVVTDDNSWQTTDVVKIFDDWITDSASYSKTGDDLKEKVSNQSREFIELGQEVTLSE